MNITGKGAEAPHSLTRIRGFGIAYLETVSKELVTP